MLRPAEYLYLKHPVWVEPDDLIKVTMQSLCLEGVLRIEEKFVQVDPKRSRRYKRVFFHLGPAYDEHHAYSAFEYFLLKMFDNHTSVKMSGVINYINDAYHDDKAFAEKFIYEDLKKKKLCFMRYLLTGEGGRQLRDLRDKLRNIEENIDSLIYNTGELKQLLGEIGTNLVLLDRNTLDKLKTVDPVILGLDVSLTDQRITSDNYMPLFMSFAGIDNLDFSSASDSFDFGGGEFGGGGAGGDW